MLIASNYIYNMYKIEQVKKKGTWLVPKPLPRVKYSGGFKV